MRHSLEQGYPAPSTDENGSSINENHSGVREIGNQVFIDGAPSQTKEDFFRIMEHRVAYIDSAEYERRFGHLGFACFEAQLYKTEHGKRIDNPVIYINKDYLSAENEDYSDLAPILVRHEIAELWAYAKTGFALSPLRPTMSREKRIEIAHGLALRKEFEYAFELGVADRYLQFIISHSGNQPEVVMENREAYHYVKKRRQRASKQSK